MTWSNRGWIAAHLGVLAVGLAPLLAATDLPLVDLPNHIGRVYILRDLASSPALREFYSYDWAFVPNLAFDVFVLVWAKLLGVLLAAKVFCLITAALLYAGTVMLHRVLHGRFSVVPMAAIVLIYNGAFLFGFVNYVLGVGFWLCAAAAWVSWRNLPLRLHAPIFAAVGLGLICVHLYAFGLFGVTVLGFEAHRAIAAWRRTKTFPGRELLGSLLVGIAPAVVPMALFFAISPTTSGIHRNMPSTLQWKAEAIAGALIFYFTLPEILLAGVFVAVMLIALAAGILKVNARCIVGLGLLIAIFAVMPRTLLSSGYADYRMPSAIALFTLASLDWGARARGPSTSVVAAAIVAMGVAKAAVIGVLWQDWQPALAAYRTAFDKLPPGAVLLTVDGASGSTSRDLRPPLTNIAGLAAARGAFVPILFGDEPGFLLHFKPDYLKLKHMALFADDWEIQLRRFRSRYTHLLVNRPEFIQLPADFDFELIASGPTFALYRMDSRP